MKNIPLHSFKEYKLQLRDSCGRFIHNLRWRCFHYIKKTKKNDKETFGFRSTNSAPAILELRKLEESLYDLVRNVQPRKSHNPLQTKLTKDKTMR